MLAGISNNHECEAREIHFQTLFIIGEDKDQLECFLTSRLVPYQFLPSGPLPRKTSIQTSCDSRSTNSHRVIDTRSHVIVTVFVLNSCLKRL